ncbi:ABC transporter ATP-binding protein [Svornostia abyssi]|uniref:ABC transporter ATP-binding protein n=1 Tax=Svornostia abyssi TaxID=2898438 RepID=A0ABY5PAQ6_9ACTN|nr:ABC transporter ATP-binding protein [Parviterribacteraceae bacterium J379]
MSPAALTITEATVDFGAGPVLDQVSLDVAAGEFVCVVGASGSGKTTLLNAIAGLVELDGGTVAVDGRRVTGPGPDRAVVFQDDAVFPWLSVARNAAFGLETQGVGKAERRTRVTDVLATVGLTGSEERWPRELSGGMRKRVDLARALAVRPPVLLMDEPYGALDMLTKERLQADLDRIVSHEGMTVVFITHDLEEAVFLADRVIVLASHPGRVAAEIRVPFARPRDPELRLTPDFQAVRGEVLHHLQAVETTA